MGASINTRQTYSEVDEFLGLLSNEQRNKIPQKLREFFREEKDSNYIKGINTKVPIREQELKKETLAIIALLNFQYWCEDENEKKRLKEVYAKNEEEYQKMLQDTFSSKGIFKKKMPTVEQEQVENKQMVLYREPIIKRVWDRILRFLHVK